MTAEPRRTQGRCSPAAHSILDDDLPDLTSGLDPAAVRAARQADDQAPPAPLEEFRQAVDQLYSQDSAANPPRGRSRRQPPAEERPAPMDAAQSRSLARVERGERRQRATMIAVCVAFFGGGCGGRHGYGSLLYQPSGQRPCRPRLRHRPV